MLNSKVVAMAASLLVRVVKVRQFRPSNYYFAVNLGFASLIIKTRVKEEEEELETISSSSSGELLKKTPAAGSTHGRSRPVEERH